MVQIVYLPSEENTMADALSREERQPESEQQSEEDDHIPGRHLAAGNVEATPPQGKQ